MEAEMERMPRLFYWDDPGLVERLSPFFVEVGRREGHAVMLGKPADGDASVVNAFFVRPGETWPHAEACSVRLDILERDLAEQGPQAVAETMRGVAFGTLDPALEMM